MRVVGSRLLWRFKRSCALALGLAALLAGCGTSNNYVYGTPVISMGDVNGDFTSYIVDIDDITFTRDDGYVVEPLATAEQVDLAKLLDLSELLEAPAFPYGTYISMTLVLDYSSPQITVNVDGQPQTVTPLDPSGDAMTTQAVTVNFDPQHPLVISPNQSTAFMIDIDLAASNTLDYSTTPIEATVQPFLSAAVLPVADMPMMRARGLLVVAQPSSSNFIMNIRPFQDLVSALGAVTVNTGPSTYFNIDGEVLVGAAGLKALSPTNLTNTPTVAYGTLDNLSTITPTFNATSVYVGTSEESVLADYVTGTVSKIEGSTLTLQGVSFLDRYGLLYYYGGAPVYYDADTTVFEDGAAVSGLDWTSISVGQQITVGGQATTNSSTGVLEYLDATGAEAGLVRLQSTQLWGRLNSATTGSVSLDLLSISNYEPRDFDFAGTGSSPGDDAVATSYRVDTGALNESALPAGTLLQVNGMVTPVGSAPPDFTASSVVQGSTVPSTMVVEFDKAGGGTRPWLSLSSSAMVLDYGLADSIHYIQTGPTKIDIWTLPKVPTITFASGAALMLAVGNYTLGVYTFNEPDSFVYKVSILNNQKYLVHRLVCVGQYDAAMNTFVATRVDVALEN